VACSHDFLNFSSVGVFIIFLYMISFYFVFKGVHIWVYRLAYIDPSQWSAHLEGALPNKGELLNNPQGTILWEYLVDNISKYMHVEWLSLCNMLTLYLCVVFLVVNVDFVWHIMLVVSSISGVRETM